MRWKVGAGHYATVLSVTAKFRAGLPPKRREDISYYGCFMSSSTDVKSLQFKGQQIGSNLALNARNMVSSDPFYLAS